MATMRDVARAAGVSPMTVSNVLHGRSARVSPSTVRAVEDAIARLGYVPNGVARALSARASGIVALVYPSGDEDAPALANPHDSVLVGEIERAVGRSGRHLMIHGSADVLTTTANLRTWSVDGALFLGVFADQVDELRAHADIPLVFVDTDAPGAASVGVDDRLGGWLAGAHLTGLGHRAHAFVGPDASVTGVVQERHAGWSAALREHGLDLAAMPVLRVTDATFEAGRAAAERLLALPEPPTAVFCTADVLAVGLMAGLADAGVRVPRDVSVVGFDDTPECRYVSPALTTVRQDVRAKGRTAVELLHRLVTGDAATPSRTVLPVELVERDSTAPPR
jgi:LacI family transcriptional regulator